MAFVDYICFNICYSNHIKSISGKVDLKPVLYKYR